MGKRFFLLFCFAAVFLLRIFPISAGDLTSDNALYAFRALGWFDYVDNYGVPIYWFTSIPWWTHLSFVDKPPLVFFFEHIFFKTFGDSIVVAKLPFVLFGLLSVWAMYFFVRKLKNARTAILAALILGVSSFATWAGLSGYLEGIELFFVLMTFFVALLYLRSDHNPRYLWMTALFFALSLMTKYTSIFLFPVLFLLFYRYRSRPVDFSKALDVFTIAAQIFVVVLLPVIIYNFFLFKTRGHFDSSLSAMMGIYSNDFGASNFLSPHISLANLKEFIVIIFQTTSIPLSIIFLTSLLVLSIKMIRKQANLLEEALCLVLWCSIVMFLFLSPAARYLPITIPFFSLAAAMFLIDMEDKTKTRNKKMFFRLVVVGVLGFEIFFNINTNMLTHPTGATSLYYSQLRQENVGFNQLDIFLKKIAEEKFSQNTLIKKINSSKELFVNSQEIASHEIAIIYDARIDWFATVWYLERYNIYYRIPVLSSETPFGALFTYSTSSLATMYPNLHKVYFIAPLNDRVMDREKMTRPHYFPLDSVEDHLSKTYPREVIRDRNGISAFEIFSVDI